MDTARLSHSGAHTAPTPSPAIGKLGRRILFVILGLGLMTLLSLDGMRYLGSRMPFFMERQMALPYAGQLPPQDLLAQGLDRLAQRIAIVQGVASEIPIEVRVIDQDSVQAFGTIGGYVVVYKGMLRLLDSEDEVAALLAHQIAHIAARHQSDALGNRVSAGIIMSNISTDLAAEIAAPSFGSGLRTPPRFSDLHEQLASVVSADALVALYGHVGGAVTLAGKLREYAARHPTKSVEFVSTHPGSDFLTPELQQLANAHGWKLDTEGATRTPMPPWLANALGKTPGAKPERSTTPRK